MSTSTETRDAGGGLVALCGVAFVVLTVVGIVGLGGDTPGNDDPAAKIVSFYNAHQNRQFAAAFLVAAATPLLAIFAAGLALALWPLQSGHRRIWPILLIGGALLSAGSFILAAFVHFALADGGRQAHRRHAARPQRARRGLVDGVQQLAGRHDARRRRIAARVHEGLPDHGLDRAPPGRRPVRPVRRLPGAPSDRDLADRREHHVLPRAHRARPSRHSRPSAWPSAGEGYSSPADQSCGS